MHIAKLSSVALLLSLGAPVAGGSPSRIVVQCDGAGQVRVCDALVQALHAKWPDHIVSLSTDSEAEADLIVRYVEKHRAEDWLSGALNWHGADGASGEGPVIEFSIMDRSLKPDDLTPYAQQLVHSTELPL